MLFAFHYTILLFGFPVDNPNSRNIILIHFHPLFSLKWKKKKKLLTYVKNFFNFLISLHWQGASGLYFKIDWKENREINRIPLKINHLTIERDWKRVFNCEKLKRPPSKFNLRAIKCLYFIFIWILNLFSFITFKTTNIRSVNLIF